MMLKELEEFESKYQDLIENLPELILEENKTMINGKISEISSELNSLMEYIDRKKLAENDLLG
jgi:hypothetical protein